MLYNYTVTLQSKQRRAPHRFKTTAKSLNEVLTRFKHTALSDLYNIKSIIRAPKS